MKSQPSITSYDTPAAFFTALYLWKKEVEGFVVSKACAQTRCSPALVTQVLQGKRKLTPERIPAFAKIFDLNTEERKVLESWILTQHKNKDAETAVEPHTNNRKAENHLLHDWLNVYIKDLSKVRWFKDDAQYLFQCFNGLVSTKRIKRSLAFLTQQGFLKRDLKGKLVENKNLVITTDNIPSKKIRAFHKNALALAQRALDIYSVEQRRASTLTLALTPASFQDLKKILQEFDKTLMNFAEENARSTPDSLYQVTINLTPVALPKEPQ